MSYRPRWVVWIAVVCSGSAICSAQEQQEWSESQIVERFLTLSPQAQELRARLALTEAEMKTRTVYPNPAISYSREGAGYNEFFEASQTLPLNGRIRYLRDAGSAAVSVADANREAVLWSLRSDLRLAFYRMVAAQERVRLLSASAGEVEQLIRILRQREKEGEGSRYDRLRAEREVAELRTDVVAANALIAAARGRISGFLPEGTEVQSVRGALPVLLGTAQRRRAEGARHRFPSGLSRRAEGSRAVRARRASRTASAHPRSSSLSWAEACGRYLRNCAESVFERDAHRRRLQLECSRCRCSTADGTKSRATKRSKNKRRRAPPCSRARSKPKSKAHAKC